MVSNGLDKVKSQRMGESPSRKKAEKDLSLESYLRNSLEDLDASSRRSRGAGGPPHYGVDFEQGSIDESEDTWAQSFQADLNKERRPKKLLGSILPYLAVAIICGATSGGALLYFMLRYSAPPAEVQSTASDEPETAYGEALNRTPAPPPVNHPWKAGPPPGAESQGEASENAARMAFSAASSAKAQAGAEAAGSTGLFPAPNADANTKQIDSGNRVAAVAPSVQAPPAVAAVPSLPAPVEANPAQGSGIANTDTSQAVVQHSTLPADQEDKMLKRGSTLLTQNDIAGARLVFHYLASHGSAKGAFALAESFDPKKLAGRHIAGVTPDANQARTWYTRAAEMGSKEAAAILRKAAP